MDRSLLLSVIIVLLCNIGVITVVIWDEITDYDFDNESAHHTNISVENKERNIMPAENKDVPKYSRNKAHISDSDLFYPIISNTTQLINTIQAGSFNSVEKAQKQFNLMVKGLSKKELDYLRIRKSRKILYCKAW